MAYTFLQLQDEVLAYGFDATTYRARVKNWLNEGQARVSNSMSLPKETIFSVPLVVGTANYTLPTDLSQVNYVYNDQTNNEFRLFPIRNRREYEERDQATRAMPVDYFIEGLQGTGFIIGLWPTPDSTLYSIKVNYTSGPVAMSADGDFANLGPTSSLHTDFDDVLISYALHKAYAAEDDAQMSSFHYGMYTKALNGLASISNELAQDQPRQIPGTWGSWQ